MRILQVNAVSRIGVRSRFFSIFATPLLVAACATQAPESRVSGEFIEIVLGDTSSFRAYAAGPEQAPAAIMITHDWFGITDFTRSSVELLAGLGYRVLAVDLYGGESASDHPTAQRLMGGLVRAETDGILDAGLEHLWQPGRRIAVIGFSMGGNEAVNATLLNPDAVAATVVVYGGGIERHTIDELRTLSGPLLAVTGSRDTWALNSALAVRPMMEEAGRDLELYIYPGADHAYSQPLYAAGANYDSTATAVTWLLIQNFLERHLRSRD